jgi:hypothetical protein
MANTIDVRNILGGNDVIVGDVKIAPGETHSFDRKQVVIGRYSPYNTYEASLYRDLANALAATTPPITAIYNGVALTASIDAAGTITGTISSLTDVDTQYTDEEYEVSVVLDDLTVVLGEDHKFWSTTQPVRITDVQFVTAVAITAVDADHAVFTVTDQTNSNTLATADTRTIPSGGVGDIAQWAGFALTLTTTTADLDLAAGVTVSMDMTKIGAGVAVAGELKIRYIKLVA